MMHEISLMGFTWLEWLSRLGLLGLSLAAGFVLFTVGLNPKFIRIPKRRYRKILTITGLFLTMAGAGLYGLLSQASLFSTALPLGIITAASLRQMLFSWQHQVQKKPVGRSEGARFSLLRPFTTMDLVTKHYRIQLDSWFGSPLKIVHLSDFHVSRRLPMPYFKSVVQRALSENPDLILITGDFVTFASDAELLQEALAGLHAPLGVFGIMGNHDQIKAADEVCRETSSLGIQMIGGRKVTVPDLPRLTLAGDEYPWGKQAPLSDELANGTLLMLTHTPDNIYRLARSHTPPAVVFAGHLHAGQIRLPYFGPVIVPSNYGRQFDQGHFLVRKTHLFVSAGVGAAAPPLRVWCQPEIIVVNIGE